jgi:outer membrane protein assembly factor BamB
MWACLLWCVVSVRGAENDWTRFRGTNGEGQGHAKRLPVSWSDKDYLWQAVLPGAGHAAPVIWDDKVFTLSATEDGVKRFVICLRAGDGSALWTREYPSTNHPKHTLNSFASSTPAVDAEQVYVAWSAPESYALRALDHQGNEVWVRDLGPYESQHSCGTSPVLFEDLVILGNDQDGVSSLVACDRRTGAIRWQAERQSEHVSYATPCLYQPVGGPVEMIFLSGAHGVTSLDPRTGEKNWEFDAFDKRTVSSPVVAGGLIFGTCGSGAGGNYVAAVRPGGLRGADPQPELVYKIDKAAPYCPSVVASGDRLFLWSDKGVVSSVMPADGSIVWQKRVGGNYYGSPICVDGRVICMSDQGTVVILSTADEFEELGRVELGEGSHSTPSVADGKLYLRTFSHLFCLGPATQP